MKKNHKSTQTIQNECPDKIPASITFGRVLLVASSIFLVFVAALELYEFITTLLEGTDASDPFDFISVWSEPLVVLFLLFCSIGGISFVIDKGPFVGLCSLCAIICLALVIADFVLSTRALIIKPDYGWKDWAISLASTQLVSGLYFVGWSLAKDWLD